jgi:hypothetical protein
MPYHQRALAALATASTMLAVSAAGATAEPRQHPRPVLREGAPRRHIRLPADYAAWSRVARCESGGWQVLGGAYPDSLGITAANFADFGGRAQPPGPVNVAQRVAQIQVADRFIAHYGIGIPDQYGCASW